MTHDEIEADRVRALARACFHEMSEIWRAEHQITVCTDYVKTIARKHGHHPAFQQYMRELGITGSLENILASSPPESPGQRRAPARDETRRW